MVAEFNKSVLIKLLGEIHIYNFFNNININENKIDYIPQEFLYFQTLFGLLLFKFNLKVGAPIILFCNLYFVLRKSNRI